MNQDYRDNDTIKTGPKLVILQIPGFSIHEIDNDTKNNDEKLVRLPIPGFSRYEIDLVEHEVYNIRLKNKMTLVTNNEYRCVKILNDLNKTLRMRISHLMKLATDKSKKEGIEHINIIYNKNIDLRYLEVTIENTVPIENYPKLRVYRDGNIYSFKKRYPSFLKPEILKSGLSRVTLRNENNDKKREIKHILIAKTCIPNPHNYKYVKHINGNITDDSIENLEWSPEPDDNTEQKEGVEWKDTVIPDYKISTEGEVKSFKSGTVKILKIQKKDYLKINLSNEGKTITKSVHKLVANAFLPEIPGKPIVDHKNRDKHDPKLSNLRRASNSENAKNIDEKSKHQGKRIIQMDMKGNYIQTFKSTTDAAASMGKGIKSSALSKSARKNAKLEPPYKYSSHGFKWVYETFRTVYVPTKGEKFIPIVKKLNNFDNELNYPNYSISNKGTVINSKKYKISFITLKGYPMCRLSKDNKRKSFFVHRLMALFFVEGRTKEKNIVDHLDENKSNYQINNLEWVTLSENVSRSSYKYSKAVKQIDMVTKETLNIFRSMGEAGKFLGKLREYKISQARSGEILSAYGYIWEPIESFRIK